LLILFGSGSARDRATGVVFSSWGGIRMLAHRWQIDLLAILSLMVAIATVYIVVPLIL
jgi:hypothetical protein